MKTRRLLRSLVALALLASGGAAVADSSGSASIRRAIFARGTLWLLTDTGSLSRLTPGEQRRIPYPAQGPVLDICADHGAALILTKDPTSSRWVVSDSASHSATMAEIIPQPGEQLEALACGDSHPVIVTDRRLIEAGPGARLPRALSSPLRKGVMTASYVTAHNVFLGVDAGEWGGGLVRIDRRTGQVAAVENNRSGTLCGGPLNGNCDPVNALIASPWHRDCVVAAIGLIHMAPHGRIVEICGDRVERVYFRGMPAFGKRVVLRPGDDEPFATVAFFGLARDHDGVRAVGMDGVYRIDRKGQATISTLPALSPVDGIAVSFALNDAVLVATDINRRVALSGSIPLLVPR